MLHAVTTGAYYPPVDTSWKILTTGASQLTAGPLCSGVTVEARQITALAENVSTIRTLAARFEPNTLYSDSKQDFCIVIKVRDLSSLKSPQ